MARHPKPLAVAQELAHTGVPRTASAVAPTREPAFERQDYDDETGTTEPAALRAVDFRRGSPLRFRTGSRRPDRVRPSLLLGSARITTRRNGDHRRRKNSHEKADCLRRASGRGLRHFDAACCVRCFADRDNAGAWYNHGWGCLRFLFRSRRATPRTRAPSKSLIRTLVVCRLARLCSRRREHRNSQ
jgi:hypothetical protein